MLLPALAAGARPEGLPVRNIPLLAPPVQTDAEKTAEKYGLEAGLWKVWTDKSGDGQSKGQQVRQRRSCGPPGAIC